MVCLCLCLCLYQSIDDVSDRLAAFCDRTIPRWDGGAGERREGDAYRHLS